MAPGTNYRGHPSASARMQAAVLGAMREMGTARLDDLAEHLGVGENHARISAEALCEAGKLRAVPGRAGRAGRRGGGRKREYVYGDGSPEQGMDSEGRG